MKRRILSLHTTSIFGGLVGFLMIMGSFAAVPAQGAQDPVAPEEPEYLPLLIQFDNETVLDELEADGAQIWRRRADMALVLIPLTDEEIVDDEDAAPFRKVKTRRGVRRVERSRRAHPVMDVARTHFGASTVMDGSAADKPYTGKGVVAGFCDTGFDPTHVTFLDPEGRTRVAQFVVYDEYAGRREVYDTHEEMELARTDYDGQFHATHVGGIMAGGGGDSPYKGIATDATIVATTSNLTDVGILAGLEDIIEYAKEQGMPAVVNMSLANHLGPHDGTSLFSRWIDAASDDAVVVISAGNSGYITPSLRHTVDSEGTPIKVRVHTGDWQQFHVEGGVAIWADDYSPVKARLILYDGTEKRELHAYPWMESNGEVWSVDSDTDEEFARYFRGEVILQGEVDGASGRTWILAQFLTDTEAKDPSGKWAQYTLALETTASPGTRIDIYSDGAGTRLTGYPGYPSPNPDMSINDLATSSRCVSVGMYVSRDTLPILGGGTDKSSDPAMTVNPRSSYGTLDSGVALPLTVAPGSMIVSSISRHYVEKYPETATVCSHEEERDGKKYHWVRLDGTSMSAPYVAGCLATWLQADPKLTAEDIQKIIAKTNRHDYPDPTNPRHGQGWFDPLAGFKEVLANVETGCVPAGEAEGPQFAVNGREVTIMQPAGMKTRLDVLDLTGRIMESHENGEIFGSVTLAAPAGIYLLRLTDHTALHQPRTRKILLK